MSSHFFLLLRELGRENKNGSNFVFVLGLRNFRKFQFSSLVYLCRHLKWSQGYRGTTVNVCWDPMSGDRQFLEAPICFLKFVKIIRNEPVRSGKVS